MRTRVALLSLLSAISCGPSPGRTALPVRPEPLAAVPAPAKPIKTSSTAAIPAEDEPRSVTVVLDLVGEFPCLVEVFRLGSRTLVVCDDTIHSVDERGELIPEPNLALGLDLAGPEEPFGRRIMAMAGRFPESAWLVTAEVLDAEIAGNSTRHRIFRWHKDRWLQKGRYVDRGGPENLVAFPWTEGGIALLATKVWTATEAVSGSDGAGELPALTKAVQSQTSQENYPCVNSLMAPEAWVELAPGDVLVFSGALCGVPTQGPTSDDAWRLGYERLRVGQKHSELSLIPTPEDAPAQTNWSVLGAAALSPTAVWVAAHGVGEQTGPEEKSRNFGLFALWDGTTWNAEDPPFSTVTGVWAAQGTFFAADETGALHLRKDGSWLPVEWNAPPNVAVPVVGQPGDDRITSISSGDLAALWIVRHKQHLGETKSWLYQGLIGR